MRMIHRFFAPLLFAVLVLTIPLAPASLVFGAEGEIAYLALGDSVASGAKLGEASSYPRLLGQRLANETGQPVRYWNRARERAESETVLATQLDALAEFGPQVVTLTVGANDFLVPTLECIASRIDNAQGSACDVPDPRVTIQKLELHLRQILERVIGETDATVVVTTYYNPFPRGARCGSAVVDLAVRYLNTSIVTVVGEFPDRAAVVDLTQVFRGHEGREPAGWFMANPLRLACSDIHPNAEGQGAIADAVWTTLSPRIR